MKGILVFRVSNQFFCIDVADFYAIISPNNLKPEILSVYPKDGIIKYNSEIIPIVNFHRQFGLELAPQNVQTQIVVVETNGNKQAFYVDCVEEIISFNRYIREGINIIQSNCPLLKCELEMDGKRLLMPCFEPREDLISL
jgi:chemotaxis signal transduction protein